MTRKVVCGWRVWAARRPAAGPMRVVVGRSKMGVIGGLGFDGGVWFLFVSVCDVVADDASDAGVTVSRMNFTSASCDSSCSEMYIVDAFGSVV